MSAADLARLVRLPLVASALVDPVAGLYLAGGASSPLPYLGVAATAACLYLGGMALNDLFDIDFDRVHHPDRVLPAGRMRSRQALTVGAAALMIGVACAGFVHPACAVVAFILAVMVLLYDCGMKRVGLLGPVVMGACRGLSLLLGASAVTHFHCPPAAVWIAAAALAVYVAAITWVSRLEEADAAVSGAQVRLRFSPGLAGLAAIPGLVAVYPAAAAAPLVLLALLILTTDSRGSRLLTRREVMSRVGAGVRGVLLVDAAVLWGAGGFALGAGVLGLFLLATLWARSRARR